MRLSHPEDFVKVSVVPKEFSLKVSRRPPGKDLAWKDYSELLKLPDEAWDTAAKKVPAGLRMFYLPEENSDEMVVSPGSGGRPKNKSPTKKRGDSMEKR